MQATDQWFKVMTLTARGELVPFHGTKDLPTLRGARVAIRKYRNWFVNHGQYVSASSLRVVVVYKCGNQELLSIV